MSWSPRNGSLDIATLRELYNAGTLRPTELVEAVYERVEHCPVPHIWIYLLPRETVLLQAQELELRWKSSKAGMPLYGIPYAIKDNIDIAGHPTTAACPDFRYVPSETATVVNRLNSSGALFIGKTNLDQFATGLTGTRSPYGSSPNPFDSRFISGGSSSGSAVAVSTGLVSFSLGTDTAGSGRVPAGFTNLVGLKPSKGLLSTKGVFPACRSLDCVSIFALTCADAQTVFHVCQAPDPVDPFSRELPAYLPKKQHTVTRPFHFGVPSRAQLEFFGNDEYAALFSSAVERLVKLGGEKQEIDFEPFVATAKLLYHGPWVAERLAAIKDFLIENPNALLPVTKNIIEGGSRFSAIDAYESYYQLQTYQQRVRALWRTVDVLLLPTTGTIYTIAEVEADPVKLNTNLGYYTNFVNLLDLCAWAVPNGFLKNGLPMGITLLAPAFQDEYVGGLAAEFHHQSSSTMGATGCLLPSHSAPDIEPSNNQDGERMELAVLGLHLTGQPLNFQLIELGARLRRTCRTAPEYRCYVITDPKGTRKPGAVFVRDGSGAALEVEVWDIPFENFGRFMARISPPLGIGSLKLDDGRMVKGFICEGYAIEGAEDITAMGGWRAYLATASA
jgi:allophanate hydrolase